ncbi:MAG: oxidoreductase [Eubacterium sp.]|jgi:predicted dehydrogenase|nr:oxidoreductase [Eubacterium sp.]
MKELSDNSKIFNAGIIGCGAIHTIHADALMSNPNIKLSAVADVDCGKARESAGRYNCRYYTGYEGILNDDSIKCIHICTPHYLHAEMAIAAMEHGKHVLVEKPMAITTSDAGRMIEISKASGKNLGICYQNRYNTSSVKIKEIIEAGIYGNVLGARAFVTWNRDEAYYTKSGWRGTWSKEGGGVLINQAIHTLDLLQWFLGDISKLKAKVDTTLLKNIIEVEDTAQASLTFSNGATALFYATNCYCTNSPIIIEIVLESAVLRLEDNLTIKYPDGRAEVCEELDKTTGIKAYWGSSHKTLINDFYSKLGDGLPFPVDGLQGIKALELLEAIYRSDREGEYVVF